MGYYATTACPEVADLHPKNRVGGFSVTSASRAGVSVPQTLENTPQTAVTLTIIASGRSVWPNRDPAGELGGRNLYGFVLGRPLDLIDPLGKDPAVAGCAPVILRVSISISPWVPVIGLGGIIVWEAWVITDEIRQIYREHCQRCEPAGTDTRQTRTPANGTPNSRQRLPDGTEREYGPDGRATRDIDHGYDHGAGDPHVHDWDWGRIPPRQPGRPPKPGEGQ